MTTSKRSHVPASASIESLGHPLAYRPLDAPTAQAIGSDPAEARVLTQVRALEGMQKEALVRAEPDGAVWRMVSDEGPYLEGTDLAPFPLAFYTAGVVFSFMSEVLRHAAARGVEVESFELTSNHYYTMQGSALRGDMIGGAKPVEIAVDLEAGLEEEESARLLEHALTTSPAEAYMRDALENTFSLRVDGASLDLLGLAPSPGGVAEDLPDFDSLRPADGSYLDDIITKLAAAEVVHGVEGGAGSSLKAVQQRTLHVRGEARLLDATTKEIRVHLLQPIGSSFRFLSQEGPDQKAPSALAYLSAGVGFCYMTQLGRYAYITKRRLEGYGIVQESVVRRASDVPDAPGPAHAQPVDTRVFLSAKEPDDVCRKIVSMGERTCFLHAAMREALPTRLLDSEPETSTSDEVPTVNDF